MMLAELIVLLDHGAGRKREDFLTSIVDENILGKKTSSNRKLTARHLIELYGLDPHIPLFRLLTKFWQASREGRPMLALICACARDPLLRLSTDPVLNAKPGEVLTRENFTAHIEEVAPGRFSPAMLLSLAQNVASSWAQAGFLKGKAKKVRQRPVVSAEVVAYALAVAFLAGLRGQHLVDSIWVRLLDLPPAQVTALAKEASRRGWLDYRGVGTIVDIRFPTLLTAKESEEEHGTR